MEDGKRSKQRARSSGAVLEASEAARVLTALYGFAVLSALIITVHAWWVDDYRVLALGGSGALVFSGLLVLARAKLTTAAGALGSGFLLGLVVVSMVTGNGVRDLSVPVLGFVMLLSNLVLEERFARQATIVTWAVAVLVPLAEVMGVFTTPLSFATDASAVIIMGALHLVLALTSRRLVRAFHRGVQRAYVQELSYRHIFNATSEAIVLFDPETLRIIDVNESAQTMFGFNREQMCRRSLEDLAGDHESVEQIRALAEGTLRGEPLLFEWSISTTEAAPRPVEASLRPAVVGNHTVLLAVVRDASETRKLQAKLQQTEKLQAVGQLAGGIAHDFNNQLTGILANASLLQSKLTDPRLKKSVDVIVRCSHRSSDLTSQLLAFARRGKRQDVSVDVHELIAEVVELLKHTIDKRIVLDTELTGDDLLVQGDPTLLQNALLNLGLNACDAMPEGGKLSFITRGQHVDKSHPGQSSSLNPSGLENGSYAEVTIRDTGQGMDAETMRRAFEPFFTTKDTGNGMGLAAVYGAVESHRGEVSVESEPGVGTSFTILLPLIEESRDSVTLKMEGAPPRFDGLRVLLAEDEDDVAQSTVAILDSLGCEVERYCDGEEATRVFRGAPQKYDLVLLDHMMPRLSGRQALRAIREVNAEVLVVLTSGYSDEKVLADDVEPDYFLPKPFSPSQLGWALVRAMESRRRSARIPVH